MDKDTLKEIEDEIWKNLLQIRPYAGVAFLDDDEPEMKFWKGQHIAFNRMRKFIEKKHLGQLVEEEQAAEMFTSKQDGKITFAIHVKEQLATLKDYDHKLFDSIVKGLVKEGWMQTGGSETFRLLDKGNAAIKIFRHAESPQVIKICFSAELEEPKTNETETKSTL